LYIFYILLLMNIF